MWTSPYSIASAIFHAPININQLLDSSVLGFNGCTEQRYMAAEYRRPHTKRLWKLWRLLGELSSNGQHERLLIEWMEDWSSSCCSKLWYLDDWLIVWLIDFHSLDRWLLIGSESHELTDWRRHPLTNRNVYTSSYAICPANFPWKQTSNMATSISLIKK